MLVTKEMQPVFGRHDGFYPKIHHIKKLVEAVEKDSKIFAREDAAITLGISKSQVKPLKYWGLAFKIIEEKDKEVFLTGLRFSLSSEGDDPYLEKMSTIMILNDMLQCQFNNITPAWYFFANEFKQSEFTVEDLARSIEIWAKETFPDEEIPEKSIRKDAECIIKMYTEDIPENPFYKLELIKDKGGILQRGGLW